MDFLIVVFGLLYWFIKWVKEEAQGAQNRAEFRLIHEEEDSLRPDDETKKQVCEYVRGHKDELWAKYKNEIVRIVGEKKYNTILDAKYYNGSKDPKYVYNWGEYKNPPFNLIKSFVYAESGYYPNDMHEKAWKYRIMDPAEVPEYYKVLEEMLHRAGRTDIMIYVEPYEGRKFDGKFYYHDRIVFGESARFLPTLCCRMW